AMSWDSTSSLHRLLTWSYVPSPATSARPYTAVVTTLAASRTAGMRTTGSAPARAACAATELARLPVEAHAYLVKPIARAAVSATETTRSLNEWVGLAESSLTHSGPRTPTSAAS